MMNLASLENVRNSGNFEVLDRCYFNSSFMSCHDQVYSAETALSSEK